MSAPWLWLFVLPASLFFSALVFRSRVLTVAFAAYWPTFLVIAGIKVYG